MPVQVKAEAPSVSQGQGIMTLAVQTFNVTDSEARI